MSQIPEQDNTSSFEMFLTMEVRDKEGKLVSSNVRRSHSFTSNFLAYILDLLNAPSASTIGSASTESTDGFARSCPAVSSTSGPLMYAAAQSGITAYGIQIGTGTVQTYPYAYKLSTQVTTGWTYNAMTIDQQVSNPSGSTINFNLTRTFVNGTGNTVVVTEVGLVINETTSTNFNLLMIYDNGNSTSVPNGSTLTVKYTLQTTM